MRHFSKAFLGLLLVLALTACSSGETAPVEEPVAVDPAEAKKPAYSEEAIDLDLTQMSATMVYSTVYDMMTNTDSYVGQTIRMNGQYVRYQDPTTENVYFSCIIRDATACCAQGIEFVPRDEADCPEEGEDVTVTGVFSTYFEGPDMYCTLLDAEVE